MQKIIDSRVIARFMMRTAWSHETISRTKQKKMFYKLLERLAMLFKGWLVKGEMRESQWHLLIREGDEFCVIHSCAYLHKSERVRDEISWSSYINGNHLALCPSCLLFSSLTCHTFYTKKIYVTLFRLAVDPHACK
jgi:hypothetical protein